MGLLGEGAEGIEHIRSTEEGRGRGRFKKRLLSSTERRGTQGRGQEEWGEAEDGHGIEDYDTPEETELVREARETTYVR